MNAGLRRPGIAKAGERFELGDLSAQVGNWRVVVEFETGAIPLSNLLKYWPYIRGELSTKPTQPLLICHFSDWWSYATRRDLWEWTLSRMKADTEKIIQVEGRQFDHWASDAARRDASLNEAIDWILAETAMEGGEA
ncbi:hypothetical protein R2Q26_01375 [Nitrosomonas sp. Is37]|nr:hypothetical protein [Nitrosomonas sp. Is37]